MRPLSLLLLLLVCASCIVPVPRPPPGVAISVKAVVRADVRVEAPAPVVAIEGAAVVEFFGIPLEDAQDVVFVLDRSGSMDEAAQGTLAQIDVSGAPPAAPPATDPPPSPYDQPAPPAPRKIDVAKAELIDALERLPAGTRMNVIFFDRTLEAYAPALVELEDGSRDGLIAFVQETVPTGATALTPAMRIAFLMNARRIVLLSDGLGNVGGKAAVLLRDAREAMRGGVRIDTIGLGQDQDATLLQTLASESGGLYQAL